MGEESTFRAEFPFVIDAAVEWAEMDAFRHVNNTAYFRYFERVRIAFFRDIGWIVDERERGVGPILASTRCRFRHALSFPDRILIGSALSGLETDRFLMSYGVFSLGQGCLVAEGDGFIISYDYGNEAKAPIPAGVHQRLRAAASN